MVSFVAIYLMRSQVANLQAFFKPLVAYIQAIQVKFR